MATKSEFGGGDKKAMIVTAKKQFKFFTQLCFGYYVAQVTKEKGKVLSVPKSE